ncbi:MAG TPA: division/cell wall cluster transcriptional repressor MraZ [Blastocatellia bacterium]|nr:division/cell wall cluster transcriptional repressor MraZ [Blastocatellia bacterium]
MLIGNYTAKMDEKGRLKIPADFKHYLEELYKSTDFYVTSLKGDSVWVYPMREWEEKQNKLNQAPSEEPAIRKFIDRVSFYGQRQQIDAQGRILIHPLLRNASKLVGDVMVMGKSKFLEVWEADAFTSRLESEPYTDEDAKIVAKYGI